MKFLIIIKQFLQDIKKQKLRTAMTTFGIVWGTIATVSLVAFGEGIYKHTQKQFHGLGDKLVILWPGNTARPFKGLPRGRWIRFVDEDVDLLKQEVPEITVASPEYGASAPMTYGRKTVSQRIAAVYPEYQTARSIVADSGGRFLNQIDLDYRKRVLFIGNSIRDDLFGQGTDPVGQHVILKGVPFLVIGVLKEKTQNSSYNGRDAYRVFIPASTYKTMFTRTYPDNIVYQVADPLHSKRVQDKVYQVLGRKYQFDPDDKEALGIWDTNESERSWKPFFDGFRIFLGVIGIFTLMVGGIGTANIMYVVVKERTREIGIKIALGATRTYIMGQIMAESLMITILGGIIGFLGAKALISIFPLLKLQEYIGNPVISFSAVLITVGVIGLIGFFAGFFPARRASRLNPVEALRL